MWTIIYLSILVMITFLMPISIFFYESDEDKMFVVRVGEVICSEIVMLLFFGLAIVLTYMYLNYSEIPYNIITQIIVDQNSTLFENSDFEIDTSKLGQ